MSDELITSIPFGLHVTLTRDLPQSKCRPVDRVRPCRLALVGLLMLYVCAFTARAYIRQYYVFLPDYVRWMMSGTAPFFSTGRTHVFVLVTDHFEPDYDSRAVETWAARYTAMAARHHDSAGRPPQHTFFYPGEQPSDAIMHVLASMAAADLGEVELHFHHGYDTAATLRPQLESAIADFQRYGFLRTIDGQTRFAFVHGNSGLDNSNGPKMCGVTTEIRMLRDLGCFADFTFPSLFEDAQPRPINSIYAARDDERPKSYEHRLPLSALWNGTADLMIFEGPLIFSPSFNPRHLFLDLDDGDLHASEHASPARVDRWVRTNVHVPERPDWVFVKLFAHGASTPGDVDAVVGSDFEDALSYLERAYNDGTRYVLHYITAREAYNLARAASEGATGAPDQYLDAYVPPYEANTKNRPFAPAWQYVDAPLSRSHPVDPKHSTERAAPNEKSQNACNVRASHRRTIAKILRTRSD